jgi:hypothetical protein
MTTLGRSSRSSVLDEDAARLSPFRCSPNPKYVKKITKIDLDSEAIREPLLI